MRAIFTQRAGWYSRVDDGIDFSYYIPTCRWISSLFNINHQCIHRSFDDSNEDDFVDEYSDAALTIKARLANLLVSSAITAADSEYLSHQIKLLKGDIEFTKADANSDFDPFAWSILNTHDRMIKPAMSQDDINQILILIQNIIHVETTDDQIMLWYNQLLTLLSSQLPLAQLMISYHEAFWSDFDFFRSSYSQILNQVNYLSSRISNLANAKVTRAIAEYTLMLFTGHNWSINDVTGLPVVMTRYHAKSILAFNMPNMGILIDGRYYWAIPPHIQYLLSTPNIEGQDNSINSPLAPASLVTDD